MYRLIVIHVDETTTEMEFASQEQAYWWINQNGGCALRYVLEKI